MTYPTDRAFVDSLALKPFDAWTGQEKMRLHNIATLATQTARPEVEPTGPYRVGEPEDEDSSSTVLNAGGEAMTADEIVRALNILIEHGTEEEHAANARTEQAQADAKKLKAMFPLLWHINDHLRTTPDQGVEYNGSTNDVDRLRDALHKLDPSFDLGTDHEGQKIDEAFVEAHSSPQNPTEAKNAP